MSWKNASSMPATASPGTLSTELDLGLWITKRGWGTRTADLAVTAIGYTRTARVYHTGKGKADAKAASGTGIA
ncbi:hypothetical protein [Nonomuraea sp. CA-141351]|uniref:hypothetical protein n=1 Tax=Nonomuraea sp. CA-141351 TaxID=3239996 RepID=UPI003D8BB604